MTEDEAKTKWCPHRRLTEIGDVRITNIDPGIHTLNCIGSDCMMWREWAPGDGFCGLAQIPVPPPVILQASGLTASELNALKKPIAAGVYSNPQPGDPDYPDAPK